MKKIFKISELQRGMIFHVQDRDRGYVFIGRIRFYGLDFIQFDVLPRDEAPSCKTRGMYTFDIGSKFSLHGLKWDDKRNGYAYDETIITSEYLEKDESIIINENVNKENSNMKFDVKKVEDKLHDSVFHVQDHDNKFQFYGIFKYVMPDELMFFIVGSSVESTVRGTYAFPAGSHFTLHRLRKDVGCEKWTYAPGHENLIYWKDITEMDGKEKEEMKEEKEMNVEVWKVKPGSWKDCVVKDLSLAVNDQIKDGDTIYRITTDYVDIKGKMTINNVVGPRVSIDFDHMTGINRNMTIMLVPEMRVFKTDSENDPGFLLQENKDIFNPELKVGKLYPVINSNTGIQSMMHVKFITDTVIDVDIIPAIKDVLDKTSTKVIGKSFDIGEFREYKFC